MITPLVLQVMLIIYKALVIFVGNLEAFPKKLWMKNSIKDLKSKLWR